MTKEPSTVIEVRTDVLTIASIARALLEKGYTIRSMSWLVDQALRDYCDFLTNHGVARPFTSVAEAKQYLDEYVGRATNRKGTGLLMKAIQKEGAAKENIDDDVQKLLSRMKDS